MRSSSPVTGLRRSSILSHLPPNVHLISHVHPNGALYEPASPKKEKRKGPARKKGDRLPGMKQ